MQVEFGMLSLIIDKVFKAASCIKAEGMILSCIESTPHGHPDVDSAATRKTCSYLV